LQKRGKRSAGDRRRPINPLNAILQRLSPKTKGLRVVFSIFLDGFVRFFVATRLFVFSRKF